MEFIPLSDVQQRSFDEHGFVVVRNAIDADVVERLTAAGDRFMETAGPVHNYYANRFIDMWYDDTLLGLATNPRILPLIVQMLSPNIQLTRTHIIYKHPQPRSDDPLYPDGDGRSFRNWHRDLNNFAPNHPIRGTVSIRVGYCLTDFTEPCSGVTLLVPGSHRLVEQIRIPKGSLDPAGYVELPLQPGDAYLFSSSCYHFPALNFQRSPAKGILVTYAYRWWSHGHPRPADELLESLDPIARQLFGDATNDEEQLPLRHWAREHGLPNAEVPPMRIFV